MIDTLPGGRSLALAATPHLSFIPVRTRTRFAVTLHGSGSARRNPHQSVAQDASLCRIGSFRPHGTCHRTTDRTSSAHPGHRPPNPAGAEPVAHAQRHDPVAVAGDLSVAQAVVSPVLRAGRPDHLLLPAHRLDAATPGRVLHR